MRGLAILLGVLGALLGQSARSDEVRPGYLELRQTAPDLYSLLFKVPALGEDVRLAIYVALPEASQMGEPPAGWITFGAPPPELGLALNACQQIEPKRGRLVLFPSTMWHSTAPFTDGERLVIAFDVGIPRSSAANQR